ncbi:MAG: tetratricopeptide repeat protein [Acidobacteriota bacterium]|nr:tetratricopeptide repeat protein [Acidobacteriota bacterium]
MVRRLGVVFAAAAIVAGAAAWWIRRQPRYIAVCAYTDAAFRKRSDWEGLLNSRFEAVNRIYTGTGVQWRLVESSRIDPHPSESLDRRRASIAKQTDCAADVLLIVTAVPGGRTASVSPFSHGALIVDEPEEPESRNELVMAHELAHLFGASHESGSKSLMDDQPLSGAMPERTAALIRTLRRYDFARGVGALDGSYGTRAFGALREELTGMAPNPALQAHLILAAALRADGLSEPAIPHLKAALALDPKSVPTRFDLAVALEQNAQEEDAVPLLREGVRLDPKSARLHAALGAAVLKQNREEAIDEFMESLRLDPSNAPLYATLGDVLSNGMGEIDAAIQAYHDALKIAPQLTQARAGLSQAVAFKTKAQQDATMMRREAEAHPGDAGAVYSHGIAEARAGNFDDAIRALEQAIRLQPAFGAAHASLATLYYVRGDYAHAWIEVNAARAAHANPNPIFIEALTRKMPEP